MTDMARLTEQVAGLTVENVEAFFEQALLLNDQASAATGSDLVDLTISLQDRVARALAVEATAKGVLTVEGVEAMASVQHKAAPSAQKKQGVAGVMWHGTAPAAEQDSTDEQAPTGSVGG